MSGGSILNIGIFTDTYFPQVSGVATSIQTLKNGLEKQGHSVFIFTTTDPHNPKNLIEPNIFRFQSVPFVSFTDRRIAVRGIFQARKIARKLDLDIVHTQTEFSMGWIGKYVAYGLKIPQIHTYHTMYEDYLHYILNGKLLKPVEVKRFTRAFLHNVDGVVAPSLRVKETLLRYGVTAPIKIIPTGVDISRINENKKRDIRKELNISPETPVLLTLSRISSEKKIDHLLNVFPDILAKFPETILVVAGDGPDLQPLLDIVEKTGIKDHVIFTGNVEHTDVGNYYRMADLFVSASDSEAQGLTYIEAMAAGTKSVVYWSDYTEHLFDTPELGKTFKTKEELTNDILDYLAVGPGKIDPKLLDEKLDSISADHFAKTMAANYQDVIDKFDEMKAEKKVNYDQN